MSRNAAAGTPASGQRYIEPATIALTTAALLVLQTRVKFKRGPNGKWSVEVEKLLSLFGGMRRSVFAQVSPFSASLRYPYRTLQK